ncbi:MAG TPA: helix-turn-helix domain-containing protein [Rhodocyclaceae bacterium]|uniref:helix-turn-helix domain-containing protein n=2 Tax=Accumulibacter sp. TaxID=2053492 RepID=UPI002C5967E9|nr:helix-turn-helix domain-containing protein [Accumulibacter sp.]HMW57592.1 helix-turn-helix domain-containing protein [Accumulibacter sp.]HMY48547.1 helix-turn-helix domain-containing protein [Rhodocyclaceae bacterium]HNA49064.1 helix-turn-helix domain-containing protein [Nitrospira sp.]
MINSSEVQRQSGAGISRSPVGGYDFPTERTVKAAVLADLLEGRSSTHRDCWLEHGSSRLAHHILVLRDGGWPIETNRRLVSTSDGRTADIAHYSLDLALVSLDPETIREYVERVRTVRAAIRRKAVP